MKFSKTGILCYALLLLSCTKQTRIFSVEQKDICRYFYLQVDSAMIDGKMRAMVYPEIKNINDGAGNFFTKYSRRFDYMLNKELVRLLTDKKDTVSKTSKFCQRLETGHFYRNIQLLIPKNTTKVFFTKEEMMLVASRFFYCDTVLKKGDKMAVGWHICVGINGLNEIISNKDMSALEAFCFEAINTSLRKRMKPVFYRKFIYYVNETNKKEKPFYTDDKSHLKKVKEQCFRLMENDMALQESLLDYFKENRETFRFGIK